ncbi:hypothetical protein ACJRO7_016861 [Eucalyptus globulus]|uniref:Uncharacterized protein n=1 Tax=Eucalyptus globulus TaxID=34317 RepID=A0ABD3KVE8_EUCGL
MGLILEDMTGCTHLRWWPNAVLIAHNRKAASLMLQRLLNYFPPSADSDMNSYVLGEKSIPKDVGIQGMDDEEALPPPPEING